ncbi:MAG: hypothetical protein M0R74_11690 [Dehalococcoidia bacterium]|nr:hypothetical protein [Dehalococcoidia bacterium]
MNLLTETIEAIKENGLKISDIIFIGSSDGKYSCSWKKFRELADREYDNGYGGNEVASDLIIVFSDRTRMCRGEYDGSEWWEYQPLFKMPEKTEPVMNIFAGTVNGAW